jgi:hypothetical protein
MNATPVRALTAIARLAVFRGFVTNTAHGGGR